MEKEEKLLNLLKGGDSVETSTFLISSTFFGKKAGA
jgi:hypothetical protein